jgi:hypothetical protein
VPRLRRARIVLAVVGVLSLVGAAAQVFFTLHSAGTLSLTTAGFGFSSTINRKTSGRA